GEPEAGIGTAEQLLQQRLARAGRQLGLDQVRGGIRERGAESDHPLVFRRFVDRDDRAVTRLLPRLQHVPRLVAQELALVTGREPRLDRRRRATDRSYRRTRNAMTARGDRE